jgi:hypothetical protein
VPSELARRIEAIFKKTMNNPEDRLLIILHYGSSMPMYAESIMMAHLTIWKKYRGGCCANMGICLGELC